MSWFVIRTKPRQEERACEHLVNQAFDYFCPWMTRDNGKKEPLFPGYLFVFDAPSEQPFSRIRSTRGVLGFVRFGMEFARAPDDLITSIRDRESQFQNIDRFNSDDRVMMKDGPFAGIEAVYVCKSGTERSVILLRWLNQNNSVTVDTNSLKLA